MQELVREYLNELNKRQKKRRKISVAVTLLIVLVVGSVVGVLMQYGVAMTGDARCGIEEHTHSEECYSDVQICGREEGEGHTHTDDCYEAVQELICGEEEGEEHTHTEECYGTAQGGLVCGQEESEGHTHTEECFQQKLTCGQEEHTHTDKCYVDKEADVEDASEWDAQYAGTEWKDAWGEDLVTAAKAQIGYKESTKNYSIAEDGSHKGYTRYGQFAANAGYAEADVYADWDAAFVNFCMHYAKMDGSGLFPAVAQTAAWYEEFSRINGGADAPYLAAAEGYAPAEGDLVFFQKEDAETDMQMGIVSAYDEEKNGIKVIEGNVDGEVKEKEYRLEEENHISAYLKITELEDAYKNGEAEEAEEETGEKPEEEPEEEEAQKRTMTAEGPDYTVTVSFTEEAGIPEDAILDVREIMQGSEEYEKYYEESLEAIGADELSFARYFDITFLADGEEIEPSDSVAVQISYADTVAIAEQGMGKAVHFAKDGTEVLDAALDMEEKSFSFVQDSFSGVGTVMALSNDEAEEAYEEQYISSLDDLGGKSFIIVAHGATRSNMLTATSGGTVGANDFKALVGSTFDGKFADSSSLTVWKFEKTSNGYYISCEKGYLNITYSGLDISSTPAALSVGVENGKIYIYKDLPNNWGEWGVNNYGSGADGIFSIYWLGDANDKLTLYAKKPKEFHVVPTVTDPAIKMTMVQHNSQQFTGGEWKLNDTGIKQGILQQQVGADGYPLFSGEYGTMKDSSFGNVFLPENAQVTEVTGTLPFLKDEEGYYYYDSLENAASLIPTEKGKGRFEIYEELVAATDDNPHYTYREGNFLPYATFKEGRISKYISEKGSKRGAPLYLPDTTNSKEDIYHFGMEMSTTFYQMKDGKTKDIGPDGQSIVKPIIYEFSGDDDLWIYIDGVLVLDLGGCHDRAEGTIDFSTGIVTEDGKTSSLREKFTGTKYDHDSYWKKVIIDGEEREIFADYTRHEFKMWYLERGQGVSNLKMKFNLPTIPPGEVRIQKQLANANKEDYANVEFEFKVRLQPIETTINTEGNNRFEDVKPELYKLLNQELLTHGRTTAEVFLDLNNNGIADENEVYGGFVENKPKYTHGIPDDGIFKLKPGQTLIIKGLRDNRKYYVCEMVNATAEEYDQVTVDNADVAISENPDDNLEPGEVKIVNEGGGTYVRSLVKEVSERGLVVYTNQCSAANSRALKIKKEMAAGQTSDDTFSFKVFLEGTDGQLKPYVGDYYLKKADGKTYLVQQKEADGTVTYQEVEKVTKWPDTPDAEKPPVCGQSSSEGIITGVSAGNEIIIGGILSGTRFKVEEVTPDSEKYDAPSKEPVEYERIEGAPNKEQEAAEKNITMNDLTAIENEGSLGEDGTIRLYENAKVTIVNSYKVNHEWNLVKVSASDSGKKLEGAKFTLTELQRKQDASGADDQYEKSEKSYYGVSGEDGIVVWHEGSENGETVQAIPTGYYSLEETASPAGYTVNGMKLRINIPANGPLEVFKLEGVEWQKVGQDMLTSVVKTNLEKSTLVFKNDVLYELPATGGSGIYWYMFSGVLLMAGAALITYKKRCKEVLKG